MNSSVGFKMEFKFGGENVTISGPKKAYNLNDCVNFQYYIMKKSNFDVFSYFHPENKWRSWAHWFKTLDEALTALYGYSTIDSLNEAKEKKNNTPVCNYRVCLEQRFMSGCILRILESGLTNYYVCYVDEKTGMPTTGAKSSAPQHFLCGYSTSASAALAFAQEVLYQTEKK
jgi:hypothetical protein